MSLQPTSGAGHESSARLVPEQRARMYKYRALNTDALRLQRQDNEIQIRKKKRYDELLKRRNTGPEDDGAEVFEMDELAPSQVASEQVKVSLDESSIAKLYSDNIDRQREAMQVFRKVLAQESISRIDDIDAVIRLGVVPRFVEFLQWDNAPEIQMEACWALSNIASGTNKHTRVVIQCSALPLLIRLVSKKNLVLSQQALWTLGNIVVDSPEYRDYALNEGLIRVLLKIADETLNRPSITRTVAWCVRNIVRVKVDPVHTSEVRRLLPLLSSLLSHSHADVIASTCASLAYLSDGSHDDIQAVVDSGVCLRLVDLLLHEDDVIVGAALRTIGNIVAGNDFHTQVVLNCGALAPLSKLLSSDVESVRRKVCWTLSNIAGGNMNQLQTLIAGQIFVPLLDIIRSAWFRTRKYAAFALTNALQVGNAEQVRHLASIGCIQPLCDLLTIEDSDVTMAALSAITCLLQHGCVEQASPGLDNPYKSSIEECGGMNGCEALLTHVNPEIYRKAHDLVDFFFLD